MPSILEQWVPKIRDAKSYEDLVGPEDAEDRRSRERRMQRDIHPDKYVDPADKALAEELTKLVGELNKGVKAPASSFVITTRKSAYSIGDLAFKGNIANLYEATYLRDGAEKRGLLKLPRSPKDSDLIAAEAKSLKAMWTPEEAAQPHHGRLPFIPRLEDTFKHRGATDKVDRTATIVRRYDGFISLADVAAAYPDGLDSRDLAWMWRRLYVALSLAHEHGIVHGSVQREHILIHPEMHGLQLVGWGNSVEEGDTVKLIDGYRRTYAPEVINKEPVDRTTDLYQMHLTMGEMLKAGTPRQYYSFISGVSFERPKSRPKDALYLLAEFNDLLERLHGERTFRPFLMPVSA